MNRHDAPDDVLATTEGPAVAGTRAAHRDRRRQGGRRRGRRARSGPRAPRSRSATSTPALDAAAFDEDGWFRTGDLGTLDAEGNLTITGRLKDVIIRKGENISAKEVEDLLFTHPRVARRGGDRPARPRQRRAGLRGGGDRAGRRADQLRRDDGAPARAAGLITRKLPEQLEVVDALPRNPSGKILKFELQKPFSAEAVAIATASAYRRAVSRSGWRSTCRGGRPSPA